MSIKDDNSFDDAPIAMLQRVGGNALVSKMSNLFERTAPVKLGEAQAALHAHDFAVIQRSAHSLKASAGQLGALQLQRTCAELESVAEHRDFEQTRSLLERARSDLSASLTWIMSKGQ